MVEQPWTAWGAAAAFVLAVVSSLVVPPLGLPDEPAHALHAVGVVHGTLAGDDRVVTDATTGQVRTETTVEVPQGWVELDAVPACYAFRPAESAACAPDLEEDAGPMVTGTTAAGTYDPAWYAAVGWPSRLLGPQAAVPAMRVVAAAVFAGLVALALVALARAGGGTWSRVATLAAVTPAAVHLAGGINPSGAEIAAALATWWTMLEVHRGQTTTSTWVRLAVATSVLAVARPLGPVLVVGILAVATLAVSGREAARPRTRAALAAVVAAGGVVAGAAAWLVARGTLGALNGTPVADPGTGAVLWESLGRVPERMVELVGVLGWNDTTLPILLTWGWLAVTGVLVLAAARWADVRVRLVLALLAVAVVGLPVIADLRSAASIGFVWQGRYTIPVAMGLPVLAGWTLDRAGVASGRAAPTLGALLATGHLVALGAAVRRFGAGADGAIVRVLGGGAWDPPLPAWLLLAVASLALGVLAVGAARPVRPAAREVPSGG